MPDQPRVANLRVGAVTGADADVDALLARHAMLMQTLSPAESCHVLTAADLRRSGALILALRDGQGATCAVGALKPFGAGEVELKSMHVAESARGRGLGQRLLGHLLATARIDGARRAWLETGSAPPFAAARALYLRAGFAPCEPFADYRPDPLSVFMTMAL